jgi:hypothetical protein
MRGRERELRVGDEREAAPPVPAPTAPAVEHILRLQRTVGNLAAATFVARQGAPAPTLPEPSVEEVIQWPEQMPRADRTGKTKLTTTLTAGGKAEPQMHGVSDVAGAGVTDTHRAWAAYIAKQRQSTPTKLLKIHSSGGWVYGGRGEADADPTQLTKAPDQNDPKTKAQWQVWNEMKHEGGASAINAWDRMGLTWGRGAASGWGNRTEPNAQGKPRTDVGMLPTVMSRLIQDADIARELKRYGIWWETGNVWLAVNTETASVETASNALSLIQGSREILAALIKIAEDTDPAHGNLHQKIVDAQWATMAASDAGNVPKFVLGQDPTAPNGSTPWPDEVIQVVAHITWGTPAIGWGAKNADAYKATGGDLGKILMVWAQLRTTLWKDNAVTNGAYLINDTQPMGEFRAWGKSAVARFLGANASGPVDMSKDMARKAADLSGKLVLKNAFGEGYYVYEPLSADAVEKLGGSSRTNMLRWLNGQSMRRMIEELRTIKQKAGDNGFVYNWMGPDARASASADKMAVNTGRVWFAMASVRAGRPATTQPGYAALPDPQKAISHDLFKIPRPKELKEVDASAE